jgi:hypothetical protein
VRGVSNNSIIFFIFFLLICTFFLTPSYAQTLYENNGISIVFPPDPPLLVGPTEAPVPETGSVMVVFNFVCNSIDCDEWEIGSADGTTMSIQFHPLDIPQELLFPFYSPNLCTEATSQPDLIINDISTIKVNFNCSIGVADIISENYIFQTQNNWVVISYFAQDQFTYDRHYQEFISSLNTLQTI